MIRFFKNNFQSDESLKSTYIKPKRSSENSLFEETSYKAIKIARRRKWTLLGIIFFILAAIVFMVTYQKIQDSKNKKISIEYAYIEGIYNSEMVAFQKEMEASKQKASDITPVHTKSIALFEEFSKKYIAEPAAWQAAIRVASYYISKNESAKAKNMLESIVPFTIKHPLFEIKVRSVLAGVYFLEGKHDLASEQLTLVEKIPNHPLRDETRLFHAQILFASGKKLEAEKLLNLIVTAPPSASNTGSGQSALSLTQNQAKIWLNYINQ